MPPRKPQPTSKKPERRSPRLNSTTAIPDSTYPIPSQPPQEASPAAAKPDSTDPIPSQPPQETPAAAKPDLDMPPRRSITASKLRKPITDKLRAAAEERLAHLRVNLRLRPLDPPPSSISAASSPHDAALRSLGLLDFARLDLRSEPLRPDLVAQLIAYYDPANRRSFVWDNRVSVCRKDFGHALSLPKKPAPTAPLPDVDPAALVSAVVEFMRVCIHPPFTDCILPQEVAAAEQAVKDGSAHRFDWTGLIWGLVEKEINELPKRDDGVCYYGAYLQRLVWVQKPELFEPLEEEKRGVVASEVSLDTDKNKQDGEADARNKGLQELEPRDADADVRSENSKGLELEDASPSRKILDELESAAADADARNKILDESEIKGVDLRINDLKELESGDGRSKILEEPEIEGVSGDVRSKISEQSEVEVVDLRSNDLNESESEDARTKILEESETEGVDLRGNDLKELESRDVRSTILGESETEDMDLRSNDLKKLESGDAGSKSTEELELGDVDANAMSKSPDTSMVADEDAKGMSLDVELESGDADANARNKSPDTSKVVDEDAKGMSLDVELESGDVNANASSKSPDTLKAVDEDANGKSLDDELESGDVDANASSNKLETPNVADEDDEMELGVVDANASSNRLEPPNVADEDDELELGDVERLEISKVADEDVKGMSLDESKAGDELGLGLEAVAPTHEVSTVNDEVSTEFAWEGDEDTILGAAEKDACPSSEVELLTQEKVLAMPEEDEEAEEEEEKDEAGWSLGISSANDDDDSMDVEENVSVQNLDGSDSDNEEAEESEHDAFEGCRGGVEMNWSIGDEKGGEGTTHCLQQCDFPGVEFENLNKGDVGMRDGVSFDDGFSVKMGSLHGMESNLLQAMNSDPATYNGTENAHDLSSGNFLAMGADAHKNGVDLGAGNSFFFGNNGKRHIEDIDGYDDQMQAQQQFLQGNQHKRMRNSSSSVPPGSAFFNANCSEPIQNLLVNASMLYEQKEREIQEALSQKQYMANLLQEKDTIIQSLNSARFEQENKLQAKLRCFEHDLNVMGQLVSGYKKALKQSHASFNEYRKKFPSNKFRYHDVPNGGGLVLSVKELERKRWEEEQQKLAAANEMIEDFQREWFSKPDDWEKHITLLWSKTEGLARELDLLKEKRKAKLATLATEE